MIWFILAQKESTFSLLGAETKSCFTGFGNPFHSFFFTEKKRLKTDNRSIGVLASVTKP